MQGPEDYVEQFINQFVGYGNWEAPVWFIGPEEAGASNLDDLLRRISAWRELDAARLVDLYEFHNKLGAVDHFQHGTPPQPTWRRLIEIALMLEGTDPTPTAIREYQYHRLGRGHGTTLLTELMPLPKPTIRSWFYEPLATRLPYLATLKSYHQAVRPIRTKLIQRALAQHRPQRVFFYGVSDAWQHIAGTALVPVEGDYRVGEAGGTKFVALKHPNARGKSREYFLRAAAI